MNIIRLDARITNVSIARRLGLAPSVVLDRMRKLKRNGYIRGFETRFDDAKLGLLLTAFVELDTGSGLGKQALVRFWPTCRKSGSVRRGRGLQLSIEGRGSGTPRRCGT